MVCYDTTDIVSRSFFSLWPVFLEYNNILCMYSYTVIYIWGTSENWIKVVVYKYWVYYSPGGYHDRGIMVYMCLVMQLIVKMTERYNAVGVGRGKQWAIRLHIAYRLKRVRNASVASTDWTRILLFYSGVSENRSLLDISPSSIFGVQSPFFFFSDKLVENCKLLIN